MAVPDHGNFVVLGPSRALWPEPLGRLVADGRVGVETVESLYEVAARLAALEGGPMVCGLLLDARILMLRDLEGLRVVARRVAVPMALLPLDDGAGPCARRAADYGVLGWEEIVAALGALEMGDEAPAAPARAADLIFTNLTDNPALETAQAEDEKSVSPDAASRYDEPGLHPLVSAQEMAALLDGGD